jgi:hypothetical protein
MNGKMMSSCSNFRSQPETLHWFRELGWSQKSYVTIFGMNHCRVARWFIFKPKIPIWEHFGGSCKSCYILWSFGIFNGHFVKFMAVWYMYVPSLWSIGIFFAFWYVWTKKNLATLTYNYLSKQDCQMVYFQTKNLSLGKFWRALDWKMLIYFMVIWNILRIFGISYDHLEHTSDHLILFPALGSCTKKNLATLFRRKTSGRSPLLLLARLFFQLCTVYNLPTLYPSGIRSHDPYNSRQRRFRVAIAAHPC